MHVFDIMSVKACLLFILLNDPGVFTAEFKAVYTSQHFVSF
jgi:hypothetical protein